MQPTGKVIVDVTLLTTAIGSEEETRSLVLRIWTRRYSDNNCTISELREELATSFTRQATPLPVLFESTKYVSREYYALGWARDAVRERFY